MTLWLPLKKGGSLNKFTYQKNLGLHDVLIKINYRTLTGPDVRFINNFWGDSKYPLVPSQEIMGQVEKVGGKVKRSKVGDFVGVGYQVWSCGKCDYCLAGFEQFCQEQKVLQVHEFGGLADYIIVNERFVFNIPKALQKPSATPLMCSGLTVFSAINLLGINSQNKVAVVGIGNLGHLALKMLRVYGCHVTAITHSVHKLAAIKKLGAKRVILAQDKNQLRSMTREFDHILVTSSTAPDWELLLNTLKPVGTLMIIGLSAEKVVFSDVLVADYSQKRVMGNYIGSPENMRKLLDFAVKHKIDAEIETFSFDQANQVVEKRIINQIPFSAVLI